KLSSSPATAAATATAKATTSSTQSARGKPAAFATATTSVGPAVAVGLDPDDSYTWLSKTMWIRLGGAAQAAVGRPQRFIRSEPSPSSTITLRCGKLKAMPRPMLDASPSVRLLKLPSLGCRWYHSTVAPPALP